METVTTKTNQVAQDVTHSTIWLAITRILKSRTSLHSVEQYAIAHELIAKLTEDSPIHQEFSVKLKETAEEAYHTIQRFRTLNVSSDDPESEPEDPVNPTSKAPSSS